MVSYGTQGFGYCARHFTLNAASLTLTARAGHWTWQDGFLGGASLVRFRKLLERSERGWDVAVARAQRSVDEKRRLQRLLCCDRIGLGAAFHDEISGGGGWFYVRFRRCGQAPDVAGTHCTALVR